jgi:phenylalanyl-tRNA synthetase alpha chain
MKRQPSVTVAEVDAKALETEALSAISSAGTLEELDVARVRYLGRKSELSRALRDVRDRETGMVLNPIRERLEQAVEERGNELQSAAVEHQLAVGGLDVTLPGRPVRRGHLHLITLIRREVEDIFLGLGYEVIDGREIETPKYLFDALNMPPTHVTRSPLHTLYLTDELVLRTETSPAQIHAMENKEPPVYMVSLGRVYRRDTIDPTHYPIFHQVEGLAVDRGITLGDLKGTLQLLLRRLFGEDREARIRTSFFPFTEPSVEADVSCFVCDKRGCRVCEYEGWIEVGGAGMVDQNVLEFVGYDPEQVSGFAFGWGLERIAQVRNEIPDIRELWGGDLRFVRQF